MRKKFQLPSSTLLHPVKDSTDVTLAGLGVDLIGLFDVNSTNSTSVEVEEEEEDDTSDEDQLLKPRCCLQSHTKSKMSRISFSGKWPMIIWML